MADPASPYTFAPGYTLAGKALLAVDVTLTAGTGTSASGADLSEAVIVGCYLKTPATACGFPKPTISGNDVAITSYTAGAIQAATDASTYTVILAGVN